MAPTLRRRQAPVVPVEISSSSSSASPSSSEAEEEEEEEEESGGSDEEDQEEECDDDSSEEGSSCSIYEVADDGEDEDDEEENGCRNERISSEEVLYDRVVGILQRRKDLGKLKLNECREYLRRHNLRISGNKAVCIQRIHEHWRIRDGSAENLYPMSSFTINCTGDVCKGDIILFKQRVYEKFDIVTRGANVIGKRTIAGKVVKESYGAAKQQHTFTVEVLWSKGVKRLPALFPLLVKGRNLYRLKTFRQPWENEAQRSIVLSEKHNRGAAARHVRAISKAKSANKGSKRKTRSSCVSIAKATHKAPRTNKGHDRNASNHQSETRAVNPHRAPEHAPACSKPIYPPRAYPRQRSFDNHHFGHAPTHYMDDFHKVHDSSIFGPFQRKGAVDPYPHSHPYPQENPHHVRHASAWKNHVDTFHPSSSQTVPPTALNRGSFTRIPFHDSQQQFDLACSTYQRNAANSSVGSSVWRPLERQKGFIHACPSPGCWEPATHDCVVSSCYSCCRRIGRRCYSHQH